jgi:hypothetical protein
LSAAHYGGAFTFTYTLPTDYVSIQAHSELGFFELSNSTGQMMQVETGLRLDRTTASLTTVAGPWSPASAFFYTSAVDQYGREFHTYWGFQ